MANISITSSCNRTCNYCFAIETMEKEKVTTQLMSREDYESALNFALRSGLKEARLLGGEPTTHPEFNAFIDIALEKELKVIVFSGGLIPNRVLKKLEEIPSDKIGLLINILPPDEGTPSERRRQKEIFLRLGSKVTAGLNIHSPAVQLDFLIDWIEQYHLSKAVRLGIAHPILGGNNEYLHPRHYPAVGRKVASFILKARKKSIDVGFDCGWVPCMFPENALEYLDIPSEQVGLRCSPIIDIMPDRKVISCFPLAGHHHLVLNETSERAKMATVFTERQESDRSFMLYAKCSNCEWRKKGQCTGGCLSGSLRRLRKASSAINLPEESTLDVHPNIFVPPPESTMIPLPVIQPASQVRS